MRDFVIDDFLTGVELGELSDGGLSQKTLDLHDHAFDVESCWPLRNNHLEGRELLQTSKKS
jgi:hypothetical protein